HGNGDIRIRGGFIGFAQQVVGLAVLSLLMGGAGGGQVVDQRLLDMGRRTAQQALGIGPVPLGELQQTPGGHLAGAAGAIAPRPGTTAPAGRPDRPRCWFPPTRCARQSAGNRGLRPPPCRAGRRSAEPPVPRYSSYSSLLSPVLAAGARCWRLWI